MFGEAASTASDRRTRLGQTHPERENLKNHHISVANMQNH
jgi:hypothetical protein